MTNLNQQILKFDYEQNFKDGKEEQPLGINIPIPQSTANQKHIRVNMHTYYNNASLFRHQNKFFLKVIPV